MGCTIIEPEHLLIYVAVKMKRLDCDVGSFQSPLQQLPEILDPVGVNLPIHVLLNMVHGVMHEFVLKPHVSGVLVGIDL